MINELIHIAKEAGNIILDLYEKNSSAATLKADKSFLTKADIASHQFICIALTKQFPHIPVISEESGSQISYETRTKWDDFFLVDPLDGTREFLNRNGEFTVNIALIRKSKPVSGVIYVPAMAKTYYAEINKGAYKIENEKICCLKTERKNKSSYCITLSRSHGDTKSQKFIEKLQLAGKKITLMEKGSALKFGLVAEGVADIYPRFAPTMEWDTAAGQIIVNEAGNKVFSINDNIELTYNKIDLKNPGFIVSNQYDTEVLNLISLA